MRYAGFSFVAAALLFQLACSDSNLTRLSPRLEITAYVDDSTFYASIDDDADIIDIGTVPVFATKRAIFKLENPSNKPLNVSSVTYTETVGERWATPEVAPTPSAERFTATPDVVDFEIAAGGSALLRIPYSPMLEGDHSVIASIESDAANGKILTVTVKAKGVFTGAPGLEIEYNGYRGPAPADCVDVEGDGVVEGCAIPAGSALNFGNIGLGGQGTARLILRNTASCTPFAGVDSCELCKITINKDPARQNIGIGFKAGTNDTALFSFEGSTATPFDIQQRNINDCEAAGEIRFLLKFQAPVTDGEFTTTVVIESNDPARPLIEVPVVAHARNAPVAVAKFKTFDPLNPGSPYTDPAHIEPLARVNFDGRGSYDPRDPADPALIGTYQWTVESAPSNADRGMFQEQGANTAIYSFWVPVAGHYVVKLKVWNTDGIESGDTDQSRVEFDVVYGEGVNVELTWDSATNDQDLHLAFVTQDSRVCNIPWDCHWLNKKPIWFGGNLAGAGPNPWLDIDDTNGLGPEHIRIKTPQPGTYRVYVHYFGDYTAAGNTPTRETLRVYLNGIQTAEYRRTLPRENAVWAVADITWNADGTNVVTPYPADASGEVGSVAYMLDCRTPGWTFP